MSKNRYVNTRFWNDTYISELDPLEKYLYLYFLTNDKTNLSGIYEIPLRMIAFETGIDKEMILKILERFQNVGKIYYVEGWVIIKNFTKHQKSSSQTVQKAIEENFKQIPIQVIEKLKSKHSLSISYQYGIIYLNSYLNSDSNSDLNSIAEFSIENPPEVITDIETIPPKEKKEIVPKPKNFIEQLRDLFCENYYEAKGHSYIKADKDLKAIGSLLKSYKERNPDKKSEDTLIDFNLFFKAVCSITDNDFLSEIDLPKLNSQINKYIQHARNQNNKTRTTRTTGGNAPKGFDPGNADWYQSSVENFLQHQRDNSN